MKMSDYRTFRVKVREVQVYETVYECMATNKEEAYEVYREGHVADEKYIETGDEIAILSIVEGEAP